MVKRLLVVVFIFHAFCLQAQYSFLRPEYSPLSWNEFYPAKKNISLSTEYYSGSTAFTSKFFNHYYFGDFIDTQLKDDVSHRLNDNDNRLGAGIYVSLMYTYKIKESSKWKVVYFAGIGSRHFTESNFSRDVFELFFRGNKGYEGQTAYINDFRYRLFRYHKLTWGKLVLSPADSSKLSFGYSGSLLLGQQYDDVNLDGSLYTAPHGEYLDIDASGNLHATDSAHTSLASINGYGASVDFYFHYPLSKSFALQVLVTDLGFINWNNKTTTITVDTTYHFEGVEVNDLFNFSDSVLSNSSLTDSAQALGFLNHHVKQSYSTILPVKASLELSYAYNEKISFSLTDEMMTGDFFRNFIMLNIGWKPSAKTILSVQASYGGYGNFNAGAVASFVVGKEFAVTVGSHALTGILFPSYFTSQGAFVSLKKYFN